MESLIRLCAKLSLAGEVAPEARVRALPSWGVSLWRHPLPNPLPQAGEGAHLRRRCRRFDLASPAYPGLPPLVHGVVSSLRVIRDRA
ncbi:hypothetical protein CVM73_34035 [Bradyrhizobium forestalis]|uniref:Uncharacterized protein n=1 Tax=Bradyrhizobium forestalis TaxID=1419263 RepID=A0A2M8QZ15_9BRAD|nr:hypothetical protein CVM73_34035 [Bradyrhizobium forestalis]